jgi:hypothetical protein
MSCSCRIAKTWAGADDWVYAVQVRPRRHRRWRDRLLGTLHAMDPAAARQTAVIIVDGLDRHEDCPH